MKREWTREEKYRYLKDSQEVKELYDSRIYENMFYNHKSYEAYETFGFIRLFFFTFLS
ncbi:MAG: hypothetical protein J6M65_09300 [Eubacterium sp.]|nr:hypothetical protein [Eubacterium sp.]